MKTFNILVEIETLDAQSFAAAADRLKRWCETFGHTAASHGFEFKSVLRTDIYRQFREVQDRVSRLEHPDTTGQ